MGLLDRFRGSTKMSPAAASEAASAGGLVLIDVRSPGEFASGHAPTARNVPLESLPGHLERLSTGSKPIAFVCQSGMRSAKATRLAQRSGLDAHNVSGGMAAWQRAGLPTSNGTARRRR